MNVLVVLPSYNERGNILDLVETILAVSPNYSVCVVDDSSPDGTSAAVEQATIERPGWKERVHLIVRLQKNGRGGAVRDGFQWGLGSSRGFTHFVEMDCDFSHEPAALPQGLALLEKGWDVALGVRYPDGIIDGWPWHRRLFSFSANMLARTLINWSIPDYTNGYRFYTRRAVETLLEHNQRYTGYIYLSESLSQLLHAGQTVTTFPIHFRNRARGVSKTTAHEIAGALSGLLSIAWRHHASRRAARPTTP